MNARHLCLAAVLSFVTLATVPTHAAPRTFVASTGLDTNPCSLAAPCRSFARALTQTDPNGELLALDSAGYGTLTVTQSVSVIAPDGIYAGISVRVGQNGITVNGAAIKVTLRGLTINGQGGSDGIRIANAGNVFIEKVTIANVGLSSADAGIHVASTASNARVFVTDTTVRGTTGHGIQLEANATVVVDRSRVEDNVFTGILGFSPGGSLTVNDSLVARNGFDGVTVQANAAGPWDVTVSRSTIEGNGASGVFIGSGTTGTYRVSVTDTVLRNNTSEGFGLVSNPGETATALIGNNRSVANNLEGIRCSGSAGSTVTLVAERNEVLGQATGLSQNGTCAFKSLGNNTVENNGTDIVGVITPATPR